MRAILEFPSPESCAECPLYYASRELADDNEYCKAYKPRRVMGLGYYHVKRAPFCPLKITEDDDE